MSTLVQHVHFHSRGALKCQVQSEGDRADLVIYVRKRIERVNGIVVVFIESGVVGCIALGIQGSGGGIERSQVF